VIAAGVPPAATYLEQLWEAVSFYDGFATRYGWDLATVDAQPHWFLDRVPQVWALQRELDRERGGG
jgi:hypothetical protein